jgi:formylglycine-generating enzyme required for sulfatase activity
VTYSRPTLVLLALLPLLAVRAAAPAATKAAPAAAPTPAAAADCKLTRSRSADRRIGYFRHCADTPEMASFRGGRYAMGDAIGSGQPYEHPVHEVSIAPFAIGRFEVTRGEWQACVDAGGCAEPQVKPEGPVVSARHPVTGVSWAQAKHYVDWLRLRTGRPYRLPTEAEWEYAARAGTTTAHTWSWGQVDTVTCGYANALDQSAQLRHPELYWAISCDDRHAETAPVGSFPANAWGVHDMQGNVWEWVEDCWHPDYTGAPSDGRAWLDPGDGGTCGKRVNRGGGWGNGSSSLRLSNRDADPLNNYSDGLGFRVALSLARPKPAASPPPATDPPPAAAPAP